MIESDRQRLADMCRFARKAVAIVGDRSASMLQSDDTSLFAVVGALILLGEASAQLSEQLRKSLPGMPWRQAKDLRNLLVHRYFEIEAEQLVDTVHRRLPQLISDLEAILTGEGPVE